MKKLLVLVEGQTEETFVKRLLAPRLKQRDIETIPTLLTTKRVKSGPNFRGGVPPYPRVKKEILLLIGDASAALVTTMLDYYGLPKSFPGRCAPTGTAPMARVLSVEKALRHDVGNNPRFLPYLSLHEYEALLFSDPSAIARTLARQGAPHGLQEIRSAFPTPEEINEGPKTHPSARLVKLFPGYHKRLHGPLIANRIGMSTMAAECPHFRSWLSRLEAL